MVKGSLISKKVKVLDCNCSSKDKQAEVDRFDFCECKVRVEKSRGKGRQRINSIVDAEPDLTYKISTAFMGTFPHKAFER